MPNGNSGNLKKMKIEAFTDPGFSKPPKDEKLKEFELMFNPSTVDWAYQVEYADPQGPGDTASRKNYNKIRPHRLSFEFVIDGTGAVAAKVEVAEEVDSFFKVTGYGGDIHRPTYLKISWGPFIWRCVLTSVDVTYTLFDPSGKPLRAKVKASFELSKEDALRVLEERKSSPDLTHVHTVQAGETLGLLCQQYYDEPWRYLQVAAYNRLNNYRRLEPGQRLRFPPIKNA
ncbi:MAG: LysM peptidoglycan-binding domain-containing protein [Candidatus Methylumidiphilus sp.]